MNMGPGIAQILHLSVQHKIISLYSKYWTSKVSLFISHFIFLSFPELKLNFLDRQPKQKDTAQTIIHCMWQCTLFIIFFLAYCLCVCGLLVHLVHPPDEVVDELLAVAVVTTLDEVVALLAVAVAGWAEFEGPEEVRGLLEVFACGEDLMDQILHTDDAELACRITKKKKDKL